jgi:hypothetical protein
MNLRLHTPQLGHPSLDIIVEVCPLLLPARMVRADPAYFFIGLHGHFRSQGRQPCSRFLLQFLLKLSQSHITLRLF